MMVLNVKVEGLDGVQSMLKRLPERLRGPAMQAAINKTAGKAQAEVNRAIRDEYTLDPKEVRNSMRVNYARRGTLVASIDLFGSAKKRGRSLNMIHFLAAVRGLKARRAQGVTKKQLSDLGKQLGFKIKKGGGLKQIEGAFIGNKGRTAFIREAGKYMASRSGQTKHSEAIKPVQVIGVSQMFSSRKIRNRVLAKINADLPVEVERAIKAILARGA